MKKLKDKKYQISRAGVKKKKREGRNQDEVLVLKKCVSSWGESRFSSPEAHRSGKETFDPIA